MDILSALLRQTRQQWQSKVGWLAIYINKQYYNTNCFTTKEEYAHQTKNYCASASGHTIYHKYIVKTSVSQNTVDDY